MSSATQPDFPHGARKQRRKQEGGIVSSIKLSNKITRSVRSDRTFLKIIKTILNLASEFEKGCNDKSVTRRIVSSSKDFMASHFLNG